MSTTIQRTAVLTGATSDRGIGMTTARRYAREGWAVVILDLDGEKSAKVAAEIGNDFDVPAFGYADRRHLRGLGDSRATDAVAAEVALGQPARRRRAGQHRRHHLAGAVPGDHPRPVEQGHGGQRHRHLPGHQGVPAGHDRQRLGPDRQHVLGVGAARRRRLRQGALLRRPRPRSSASPRPWPARSADTGVTVNAVTPGAVDTNIRVGATDEQEAGWHAGIPLGRNATTEEIAAVITFLSSPRTPAYLTGTTIDINGGSHIH